MYTPIKNLHTTDANVMHKKHHNMNGAAVTGTYSQPCSLCVFKDQVHVLRKLPPCPAGRKGGTEQRVERSIRFDVNM
jgi:hypothetical protein